MKLKYSLLIAGVAGILGSASAQTSDPVLMRVGNDNVTLSEFEMIYKKNLQKDQKITQESLDEYIKLFTNFKLKVQAAKDAGIDTGRAFVTEYSGYRRQLAQPYLKDKAAEEKLARIYAERAAKDVRVSHILIKTKNECDTAAAAKKAQELTARLKKGLKWEDAVAQYSEDEFSKAAGGDLGWFTSGMWAYAFENAAYGLKNNEVSAPVKTSYGYHIIRKTDERAARGEVKVAHIFVAAPEKDADAVTKAKTKISEAYDKLSAGAAWTDVLMAYSEDRNSMSMGGELPAFGIGQMVPSFEDAAYGLKTVGEYSKPIQTKFGWHILRLSEKKTAPAYDQDADGYLKKVQKSAQLSRILNDNFTARIKPEVAFSENQKFWSDLLASIGTGNVRVSRLDSIANAPLFSVEGVQVMYKDFADYFKPRVPRNGDINYCSLREKYYMPYVQQKVGEAYESKLETKFPEYRSLMKEFKEGMMQFELMKQNVWDKSVEDTAGLRTYFNQHRSEYMWGPRNEAIQFTSADSNALAALLPSLDKLAAGKTSVDKLLKKVNKKETVITTSVVLEEKTDNEGLIATHIKSGQVSPVFRSKENQNILVLTTERAPEPKDLKDVKGAVISKYQEYLENEWINVLKARYPVQVDNKVLYKLITR